MKISTNVQIIELGKPDLDNPILIQGIPGLGYIGKIAVDFLIDQLKPIKFAELYSSYILLRDGDVGVNVELDSTFTLPKYEFFAHTGKSHIILLTGDIQPRPWGQYNVAKSVLEFVGDYRCRTLIAIGGYAIQRPGADAIYVIASESETVKDLREKFSIQPAQSGTVKGAFGVMLGLAKGMNMKCLGLLGATVGTYPDLRASRNIVQLLTKMFDLPLKVSELDKRIADMESRVKRFSDIRSVLPESEGQEGKVPTGYIS